MEAQRILAAGACVAYMCFHAALAHDLPGIDIEAMEAAARLQASLRELHNPAAVTQGIPAGKAAEDRRAAASLLGNYRDPTSVAAALAERFSAFKSVIDNSRGWNPGKTLTVCFFNPGNREAKKTVAEVASVWTRYANVKFDFGTPPEYAACKKDDHLIIRIGLTEGENSSLVGTEALDKHKENAKTMRFSGADSYRHDTARFRWLVLHEFGHALGLQHEHQHPLLDCRDQLNAKKIMERYGWDDARLQRNLNRIQVSRVTQDNKFYTGYAIDGSKLTFSEYDRESVMHYDLAVELFNDPPGPCYVNAVRDGPSKHDQEAVARAYPPGESSSVIRGQNALIERIIRETPGLTPLQQRALQSLQRSE